MIVEDIDDVLDLTVSRAIIQCLSRSHLNKFRHGCRLLRLDPSKLFLRDVELRRAVLFTVGKAFDLCLQLRLDWK